MKNLIRIFPAVVFVVLFLTAFDTKAQPATPQLNRDELLALRSLQTIHGAESTYFATYGNGTYTTLAELGNVQFIDSALASGIKYGYVFGVVTVQSTPTTPAEFFITATPRKYRAFGRYSFFLDTSGVIRGADKRGQPANASDPVLVVDFCTSGSITGNELCTIQSLRTLHGAEATYQATHGNGNYTGITELGRVNLINGILATGLIHGYSISVVVYPFSSTRPAEFRIIAVPQIYGVTGVRSFYIGTDGVIYGADKNGRPASESDPPIND